MTDATDTTLPTRQSQAIEGRSGRNKVSGKLKTALDFMVWKGLKRNTAAIDAGLTEHALYSALRKPHVKAYYLEQLDVLRTSERARNIHRLCEIREAADNMPAVQAIDRLMRSDDDVTANGNARQALPGVVIQIVNTSSPDRSTLVNVSGRDQEDPP